MEADSLMQVLRQLPKIKDSNLIVGNESADDAAVYRLTPELAVVSTLDFFPPMVNDPYDFGVITAANALSDIYAMGAKPVFATAMVCFPKTLDPDVLVTIMTGSIDKLKEAGIVIAGGHTIEDEELKYGLSVTGTVHPEKVVKNIGVKPGDMLILTKPLGIGVITSAIKAGKLKEEDAAEAFESMKVLNKSASEAMVEVGVNACTDITGFGLLGHASEMAGDEVTLKIYCEDVRIFPEAERLVMKKKNRPRAIESNRAYLEGAVVFSAGVNEATRMLFFDPQTSGGLLIAVSSDKAERLLAAMKQREVQAVVIGEALVRGDSAITVF
jgi:selenide,water dikinase